MGGFLTKMSPAAMVADKGPKALSPALMAIDQIGKKKKDPAKVAAQKPQQAGKSLLGNA